MKSYQLKHISSSDQFKYKSFSYTKCLLFIICLINYQFLLAQTSFPLTDLSSFKNPGKSWSIAGDAIADLNKAEVITASSGTGVLVNNPSNHNGADLYTNLEHGDIDLELDYMMAKGSNSGIYLQSRYEVQLLDSWGVKNPTYGDNGGVYERWDESRGKGHEGYEGYAPRQNASKAPGLWQHIKISFQAPRFDSSGHKVENAKMVRIELNGVPIHEDVELLGPTRGAVSNDEKATAPLRFQGDHGPVAFRNIKITAFNRPRPEISNLRYSLYKGRYNATTKGGSVPPEAQGTLPVLSASTINIVPAEYYIQYTGTIKIIEPGVYSFRPYVPGGRGIMKVNGQLLKPQQGSNGKSTINLQAGDYPFEILYTKNEDFSNRSFGLSIAGPGIREYFIGDEIAPVASSNADQILVNAPVNTILRSFTDLYDTIRITHAVNVGSPEQVHYTYDMEKGSIAQVWRGGFLDASPMWIGRGDGSSRPVGAVTRFGKPRFTVAKLASANDAWPTDSTGSNYFPKGYRLDKNDVPTFRYSNYGSMVEDAITMLEGNQGFRRTITMQNPAGNFYALIAQDSIINPISNELYLIGDKSYYIRIDDAGGAKPVVRESNGHKELMIPIQNKITYSILF